MSCMTGSDVYGRIYWMNPADDAILRLLAPPKSLELITSDIAHNAGYSPTHVRRRLRVLQKTGLVEEIKPEDSGYSRYGITPTGKRYVENKISVQELKELGDKIDDSS